MKTQHTPGPWSYSPQKGKPGHCLMAQVWGLDGTSLACIEPTEDENEASATALLMTSAPELLELLQIAIMDHQSSHRAMTEVNKEMGFDPPQQLRWVQVAETLISQLLPE